MFFFFAGQHEKCNEKWSRLPNRSIEAWRYIVFDGQYLYFFFFKDDSRRLPIEIRFSFLLVRYSCGCHRIRIDESINRRAHCVTANGMN